jgi:hypothetical protein
LVVPFGRSSVEIEIARSSTIAIAASLELAQVASHAHLETSAL